MAFLTNIQELQKVRWRRDWLWDVRFLAPDIPATFKNWFPATDITENLATIQSFQFDTPLGQAKVPWQTTPFDLQITFQDDIFLSLHYWLANWINTIVNSEKGYVLPISMAVKPVQVAKLDEARQEIRITTYYVYPDGGGFNFTGTSNSDSGTNQFTFHIAKIIDEKNVRGSKRPSDVRDANIQDISPANDFIGIGDAEGHTYKTEGYISEATGEGTNIGGFIFGETQTTFTPMQQNQLDIYAKVNETLQTPTNIFQGYIQKPLEVAGQMKNQLEQGVKGVQQYLQAPQQMMNATQQSIQNIFGVANIPSAIQRNVVSQLRVPSLQFPKIKRNF